MPFSERVFIGLFLLLPTFLVAQSPSGKEEVLDSLASYRSPCAKLCLADSAKVNLFLAAGDEMETVSSDSVRIFYKQALQLAQEINWPMGKLKAQIKLAYLHYQDGEFSIAKDVYTTALQWIDDEKELDLSLLKEKAGVLGRIGAIYWNTGKYPEAIDHYLKSLKISESIGDKLGISTQLGNIGLVYWGLGEYEKALDYHQKALEIDQELDNKSGMAADISNIGVVYADMGMHEKALEYYFRNLVLADELGNRRFQSIVYGNIGIAYKDLGNYDKALDYHMRSVAIAKELDNKRSLSITLGNLGETYFLQNKPNLAESYLLQSLMIADSIGALDVKKYQLGTLSNLYTQTRQFEKALAYHKQLSEVKDAIFSIEKEQDITRKNLEYEYEKTQLEERANYERQLTEIEAERNKSTLLSRSVALGLFLTLIFMSFVVRSLKNSRKQTKLIQHQKNLVESHQQEIIDSINYAKSLQEAIMPPRTLLNKCLEDHFIFYRPKDIIAGDFYWLEETNDFIFWAVADCTGHGVSGAMISIVCSNALNRAVKEGGLSDPGEILHRVNALVQSALNRDQAEFSDGMDISLVAFRKSNQEMKWAGANLPLWIYRSKGKKIDKYHPNKQPIGTYFKQENFLSQRITFDKGDVIYLFSDGFQDQFGGPKGKKYMKKYFEEFLLSHAHQDLSTQLVLLATEFEAWKRDHFQVDDVTVFGIKI